MVIGKKVMVIMVIQVIVVIMVIIVISILTCQSHISKVTIIKVNANAH